MQDQELAEVAVESVGVSSRPEDEHRLGQHSPVNGPEQQKRAEGHREGAVPLRTQPSSQQDVENEVGD